MPPLSLPALPSGKPSAWEEAVYAFLVEKRARSPPATAQPPVARLQPSRGRLSLGQVAGIPAQDPPQLVRGESAPERESAPELALRAARSGSRPLSDEGAAGGRKGKSGLSPGRSGHPRSGHHHPQQDGVQSEAQHKLGLEEQD